MTIKTVWAYLNGERKWDVVDLALKANMMLADMKKKLKAEYPDIVFKVEAK